MIQLAFWLGIANLIVLFGIINFWYQTNYGNKVRTKVKTKIKEFVERYR